METQVNNENKRRKKSSDRRSSILKMERPTLADLDVNRKKEKRVSRRVSFAETYQVKEFPKDSPQRWLRDLHNADSDNDEGCEEKKPPAGLDQLLNGSIHPGSENENLNKTVLDGVAMDETVCANTTIQQNTSLSHPGGTWSGGGEEHKVDTFSFLTKLTTQSEEYECEPFIKPVEDSDDEEGYKASSFFRGGSDGFFSNQTETDKEGKIDNRSFLAKLQGINASAKKFSQEREKREMEDNQTVVYDGMDADMEMTSNFTSSLESLKKRQSIGNVLESTRVHTEVEDVMEMTRNLTTNLEVLGGNLQPTEYEVLLPTAEKSTLGRSTNRGFEQTRVFSDYEDPTANMDFTLARGGILNSTAGEQTPRAHTSNPHPQPQLTPHNNKSHEAAPEVTINFGQQEVDADMEMTEALDPTLVVASRHHDSDAQFVQFTQNQVAKSSRALADVTVNFESRKENLQVSEKKRKTSVSPAAMGKENETVNFKSADYQADMEFTSCLTTQVLHHDKENIFHTPKTDKTQVFSGGDDIANMELTTCIEKNTHISVHVDETVTVKKVHIEPNSAGEGSENKNKFQNCEVTQIFGSGEDNAAMELTSCLTPSDKSDTPNKTANESDSFKNNDKTRVFGAGDNTAAMELTECIIGKKHNSPAVKSANKTVHFDRNSMELTCQETVPTDLAANDDQKTKIFTAEDTATMEMTTCQTGMIETTEKTPKNVDTSGSLSPKPEEVLPKVEVDTNVNDNTPQKEHHTSESVSTNCEETSTKTEASNFESETNKKPDVAEDSEQSCVSPQSHLSKTLPLQEGENKNVQPRRSLHSGMTSVDLICSNITSQSLKRQLYSFDMVMAAADARIAKGSKSKGASPIETSDSKRRRISEEPTVKTNENDDGVSKELVEKREAPKKAEAAEIMQEKKSSPSKTKQSSVTDMTEHTSTNTEILKLTTSEQEMSALEVLKNLALEEDTLDDTKLLELRMLAKKNMSERPAPIAESAESPNNKTQSSPQKTDDKDLTNYNTTTALTMLVEKMNKTKADVSLVADEEVTSKAESPVIGRKGTGLAGAKHGSPDPISSGDKKKSKLEDSSALEKSVEALSICTLESIEQPLELVDGETVTSLGGGNDNTQSVKSQSAMSLSHSLLSYSIAEKKFDDEGPWTFEMFCEKMGVSQFRPKCARRSSFNVPVTAESLEECLKLQTVTRTDTQVKGQMYNSLKQQLDRDEEEIKLQEQCVMDEQPPLFDQVRAGLISQEEVHACYKACFRMAKAGLKKERVDISKKCLKQLKTEKDKLCVGLDEVVTQVEKAITDISSVDSMLADIDKEISESKSEPVFTKEEIQNVTSLHQILNTKEQELKKTEEERADLSIQQRERQERRREVESERQKQELRMVTETRSCDSRQTVDELQNRLAALSRVLEWEVKELSESTDIFLFLYGGVELSVGYDVIQHKTIDSLNIKSRLAEHSAPWSRLAARLVVDAIDYSKLRSRYPSRDKLPQLLHEVSSLVSSARKLADEISCIDLRRRVTIQDNSVVVSLLNSRKVRKILLTFTFAPGSFTCSPVQCGVDVVIGNIQKEKVEDVLKENMKSESLTKCIQVVQDVLNS